MIEKQPLVYVAIKNVQEDMAKVGISKDQENKGFGGGYKYRGIDAVYQTLAPLLAKHSLVIIPRTIARECVERQSSNNKALFYVSLDVEFDFISSVDGSTHTARTFGEAMDSGDKATNKALTAAYKYLCFTTFCIPVEASEDADATTHEIEPEATGTEPSKPPKEPKKEVDSDIKTELKEALHELCSGDPKTMARVLKECTVFKGKDGKEIFIEGSEGIAGASDKWCEKALDKVKKRLEGGEPPNDWRSALEEQEAKDKEIDPY